MFPVFNICVEREMVLHEEVQIMFVNCIVMHMSSANLVTPLDSLPFKGLLSFSFLAINQDFCCSLNMKYPPSVSYTVS